MKKISLFFIAILTATVLIQSCRTVKKTFTSVKEHETEFIVLWLPPEGLDTATMTDENQIFMVEGNLLEGNPVLAFVKAKRVKEILRLQWKFPNDGFFRGYLFTCDDLGKESLLIKDDLNSESYSEQQRELLRRHWNERKYDLFSQASKAPIKGRLDLKTKRITPLKTASGDLVYDNGTTIINSTTPYPNPNVNINNNNVNGSGVLPGLLPKQN